ncbi:ABC transporter permease [Intestinibacter sp.]|uniref:ABC transporter permease n=1 Tax=Intestinibacter sp. TaxID=1965304 RepID=UPI002A74B61D|nr:ABC transporter permease [Intestinibacter sp.]MDY2738142.1 ABC transporter permease [Intestinibacter sp.]
MIKNIINVDNLKKLASGIIIILGITFISFALMYISPGDPVEIMMSSNGSAVSEAVINKKKEELGLNKSFLEQYTIWLKGLATGNLGTSIKYNRPVTQEILSRLPATLYLALLSLIISVIIALPIGIFAAANNNKISERIIKILSLFGPSMPSFFIALVLMYIVCYKFRLLPVSNSGSSAIILPTITIVIGTSSKFIRQIKSIVLEELSKEYVIGLQVRGVSKREILFKHVLKGCALPIATMIGLSLGSLLGGSTIVETVFMWPGIGKYAVEAIASRDYPVVQGYVVWMSFIFLIINYLTDKSYYWFDPRLKLNKRGEKSK